MNKIKQDHDYAFKLCHFTIERARDAVIWIDAEAKIHRANETAAKYLGYPAEELSNMTIFEVAPDYPPEAWPEQWKETKDELVHTFETTINAKDGRSMQVEITNNFVEVDGKEYVCSFIRDITARKQVEEELQENRRFLNTLMNNLPGMVYRCQNDMNWTMEHLSDGCFELTGYKPDELIQNKVISFGQLIHPDHRQRVWDETQVQLKENFAFRVEYPIIDVNNKLKWLWEQGRGVFSDNGKLLAIEGFITDITERKQAEKTIKNTLKEVKKLKNQLQAENMYLQSEIKLIHNFEEIITQSKAMNSVLRSVEQVASTDATVLVLGETGTGKELLTRAVHNISPRQKRPLVKVNCAALPANLIESELFGHEKGAFTGAVSRVIGRFELADGGTIFLDEIGDLPAELQIKLLRVLQESEFQRLGSPRSIKVDVRVIVATNRDLEQEVEDGLFREDLYYRLNIFPIKIPPLRERKEDIHLLVNHFVKKYQAKFGRRIERIPRKVMDSLQNYHWPGNIRELENIIERAVVISEGDRLELGDWLRKGKISPDSRILSLSDHEKEYILETLEKTGWRITGERGAAKILGLKDQTLASKMRKLGIKRPH